jgi:hypothetical protein
MGEHQAVRQRLSMGKIAVVSAVVALLVAISGYALQRELAPRPPAASAAASFAGGLAMGNALLNAPALSAEEEAYAAALWSIHSEVKLSAVRMIFAGIEYKTEGHDAGKLVAAVKPLTGKFAHAAARVRDLDPPATLQDAHQSYLEALDQYAHATREMMKVAADGKDEHLVRAQQRSEQASVALLKLSDALWPGEYKPN